METRISHRAIVNLEVILKITKDSKQQVSLVGGDHFSVKVFDISVTGMGVLFSNYLPKGLLVDIDIKGEPFGIEGAMSIKGEVCYCNYIKSSEYKCGIKFNIVAPEYAAAISTFITRNEKREKPRVKLSD